MQQMMAELAKVRLPAIKILITGAGRVAAGAMETLAPLGYSLIEPAEYLEKDFDRPVICQIEPWDYVRRKDGEEFDLQHFFYYPEEYDPDFYRYSTVTDLFIPCHYWDPRSPVFLEEEDYRFPISGFQLLPMSVVISKNLLHPPSGPHPLMNRFMVMILRQAGRTILLIRKT
jgi:saccharopine dehydrogenase (NAD+, L-lysine forming)